jgi:hypothetical protein
LVIYLFIYQRKYRIDLFILKAHTTHFSQPLDNGENGLLKTFLKRLQEPTTEDWTARSMRQCVAETLPRAYSSAFTFESVIRSFRVTGIWPVDASQVADSLHYDEDEGGPAPPSVAGQPAVAKRKERDEGLLMCAWMCAI